MSFLNRDCRNYLIKNLVVDYLIDRLNLDYNLDQMYFV